MIILCSAKFWLSKTRANRLFQSYGEETFGKFTISVTYLTFSYFRESGIWLDKMLENDVHFAKFAKVFPARMLHSTVASWLLTLILSFTIDNACNNNDMRLIAISN